MILDEHTVLCFNADFNIVVGYNWADYERRLDARISAHVRSVLDGFGFDDIAVVPASPNRSWVDHEQAWCYRAAIDGPKSRLEQARTLLALLDYSSSQPEAAL